MKLQVAPSIPFEQFDIKGLGIGYRKFFQCDDNNIIAAFCLVFSQVGAQETLNPVVVDYVRTYADYAIREMQRTGVPAAIKLAQGILETEVPLRNKRRNLFYQRR